MGGTLNIIRRRRRNKDVVGVRSTLFEEKITRGGSSLWPRRKKQRGGGRYGSGRKKEEGGVVHHLGVDRRSAHGARRRSAQIGARCSAARLAGAWAAALSVWGHSAERTVPPAQLGEACLAQHSQRSGLRAACSAQSQPRVAGRSMLSAEHSRARIVATASAQRVRRAWRSLPWKRSRSGVQKNEGGIISASDKQITRGAGVVTASKKQITGGVVRGRSRGVGEVRSTFLRSQKSQQKDKGGEEGVYKMTRV